MTYVFDTSPITTLFKNYYRSVFKTLWQSFDDLVEKEHILSTREVLRELEDYSHDAMHAWLGDHKELFAIPTPEEAAFVKSIFQVHHFQQNIEGKKLLKGGKVADPFVAARAAVSGSTVVTVERWKENAADLPNICRHFKIPCQSLEEFMQNEGWTF
jgi:hypothetical protein